MQAVRTRQGKITPENIEEAAHLRALWEAAKARGAITSQEAFGEANGIGNQAAVGFFLNGKTALSMKAAIGFARGLGCRVADFSPRLAAEIHGIANSAGSASEPPITYRFPITIEWGDRMDEFPESFGTVLPDDSMAPDAPAGALVWFERDLEPRAPDWVLLVDDAGHWYLREYKERRPGHWEAHAINKAYLPLDSLRDGLRVAAVYVGMKARRG